MRLRRTGARRAALGLLACGFVALSGGCQTQETLNVYVAASLGAATRDALAGEPRVRFSAAGSQTLARQIAQGAPASLFLPAAARHLEEPGLAPRLGRARAFLCNRLAIVAAPGVAVRGLEDLSGLDSIVLGVYESPVGAYANALLDSAASVHGAAWRADVEAAVRSRELDARQVAARVARGEADAAIVYRTDALAAGLTPIEVPEPHAPLVRYSMAPLLDGPQPARAEALAARLAEGAFDEPFLARGFERCP